MKYYIIAGEPSGDLHASNLMKSLLRKDTDAKFRFWGGDLMKAVGGDIVKHYRDLAFMGFIEVMMHIRTIADNISLCKKDIMQYRPDALILVDYPGFNLRIAKFAHESGLRVIYYISPQLWAWHSSRVRKIRDYVDKMLVILPFEKEFYSKHGYNADFTGHPLLDVLDNDYSYEDIALFRKKNNLDERPVVALLPGSRKQEVTNMLKVMLSVRKDFPSFQFVIAKAPSLPASLYNEIIKNKDVRMVDGQTYDLLHHSEAALVTSGTATLETALTGTPQVVCYRGNHLSYLIAKQLIRVKFISLVNLIMNKMIVKELIQNDLNHKNLSAELSRILHDNQVRNNICDAYEDLKEKLGGRGASDRAADIIFNFMKN